MRATSAEGTNFRQKINMNKLPFFSAISIFCCGASLKWRKVEHKNNKITSDKRFLLSYFEKAENIFQNIFTWNCNFVQANNIYVLGLLYVSSLEYSHICNKCFNEFHNQLKYPSNRKSI